MVQCMQMARYFVQAQEALLVCMRLKAVGVRAASKKIKTCT